MFLHCVYLRLFDAKIHQLIGNSEFRRKITNLTNLRGRLFKRIGMTNNILIYEASRLFLNCHKLTLHLIT